MNIVLLTILQTIYVALPGIAANTTPPVAASFRFLEFLNKPIDGGLKFRGKELLGSHKTIRGFVVGIPSAMVIAYVQFFLWQLDGVDIFRTLSPINFDEIHWALFGFMIGLGTLVGDAVKSFFKRQVGKKPGESWFPWDQIDSVLGAVVFVSIVSPLPWGVIVTILFLGPGLHLFFDSFGRRFKLKQ